MKRQRNPGKVWERTTPGFDAAVLATSFSGRDPGVRPKAYIQANNPDDVIAAVQRARRENLKVSLVSGGHSWAQNHLREGGLLIDLSRLHQIEIDEAAMTARVGPGCWSVDLDIALKKRGLFFPVAHAPDVCLGGYLLQGGFGWNGRALGLACESVIGIDVVLAEGSLVHANQQQHADLYWAARGAGPGFFGVVVRYHLRLYPHPKVTALMFQVFRMTHMEEVFRWADEVGPSVPRSVEFQMLLTPKALGIFSPGIEVIAPVLADSWEEAREAVSFIHASRLRPKASFTLPLLPMSTVLMSYGASFTHFPDRMRWCADNMWTNTPIDELLPGLRRVADTLPPAPSHALWLNWQPPAERPDMAFSVEANRYFAVYGEWKHAAEDARYESWATDCMGAMAEHSQGIQLADENLGKRPARFMRDEKLAKLNRIRAKYDPEGRFQAWMGRIQPGP